MFQALYRKYRPQNFTDIVGQGHIVSVLKNAINKNQISHAYLFYGPRGTGKTSIAKIFANEVNENKEYQKENVDIIEIDAASNNGVDEVRDIKEAIKFLPNEGKYKVYIIDEVHMLTTAAFNALLKTLEEPPSHVIFILATTEIHKIPATILSRCQRFEFKNLTTKELEQRLDYIAKEESISIEDKALKKIATLAKGGLRDAISILDQASNYADNITLENILEITSSLSEDSIVEFYANLLKKDVSKALTQYSEFVDEAKDTKLLLNDLINITRDVIVYKNLNNNEYTQYNIENIKDEIANVSFDYFYKIIEILSETEQYIRFSTEYMSYMQICIVKICLGEENKQQIVTNNVQTVDNNVLETKIGLLQEKIQILEQKIKNIAQGSKETNIVANSQTEEKPKITEVIVKDKKKIKDLLAKSNDKFTAYASKAFEKIIQSSSISTNVNDLALKDVFNSCSLVASSKDGGIIVFHDENNMIKMAPSSKHKEYLENKFKALLGVNYSIYTIQDRQYEVLLNENVENSEKENKESEIKAPTIENLFADIIIEK